jgi:drug/metabolite transporter superfamily protein YnfA
MKRGDGALKGGVRDNVALLLLFSAEMFLKIVHQVMKFSDIRRVGRLFALHGGNNDLMAELEFGQVGCFVRFGFSEFEALG